MASKKTGLGRGLDALFAASAPVLEEENNMTIEPTPVKEEIDDSDRVVYIDINEIKPNPDQPRKHFDAARLEELANSIQENGVIQPLVVQKKENCYELVAGERRWRASRLAGLKKVPCLIREFDEKQNLIVAIIENMQREDLDPMEEANGIQQMIHKFGFTQEQVSESLGKSRAYIANSVRLLKLPEEIQKMIRSGKISATHGRTLLGIQDPRKRLMLAERIEKEGLSVRTVEEIAKKLKGEQKEEKKKEKKVKSAEILAVESDLRNVIGTKVSIVQGKKSGKIELEYYSIDELNRLIDLLKSVEK
ncbi:MAG: ParB/RepB/Spo0J family partition protein [Eubacteriales bacterium]|nr:ParB/RepB/Spo0J family partition protein [Eubacteriales bacterium]